MFNSAARYFCALFIFLTWMAWAPATSQASCADGRPEPRETCAYLSFASTITTQSAKADNLLISEGPALARQLTQECLQAERRGSEAPQACWQDAAADARRFTQGVSLTAADELRALAATWADLARKLQQERTFASRTMDSSAIEPVADSPRVKKFSSARVSNKIKKRKIAAKSGQPNHRHAAEKTTQLASSSDPKVRSVQFKKSLGEKRYGLAWRKEININKSRVKKRKPPAPVQRTTCLFGPKMCKE
jgi:hypothetical protein